MSSSVSIEMDDYFVSWVYRLGMWATTQANSAFYPQQNGKWVPAKGLWSSATGK